MKKTQKGIDAKIVALTTAAVFIVSWCALAVFSMLYIGAKARYETTRRVCLTLQQQINALNKKAQVSSPGSANQGEKEALDFLEWQFVVKEQVKAANADLAGRIAKIKDAGKDKGLQNLLYYNLGLSCILAVDYQKAIEAFNEALKLDPADAASAYNLGLLYSVYGNDSGKAVKYYRKYLELSPSAPNAESVKERIASLSHGK